MFNFLQNDVHTKYLSWYVSIIQTYLIVKEHRALACYVACYMYSSKNFPEIFFFFNHYESQIISSKKGSWQQVFKYSTKLLKFPAINIYNIKH